MKEDTAHAQLTEAVAERLLGFRWMRWRRERPDGGPMDEEGRFLAPPEGLLTPFQTEAEAGVPDAIEPYRYLPPFLEEVGAAMDVAIRAGLFREKGAHLTRTTTGEWELRTDGCGLAVHGRSLPEVLCRASLAWTDARKGD